MIQFQVPSSLWACMYMYVVMPIMLVLGGYIPTPHYLPVAMVVMLIPHYDIYSYHTSSDMCVVHHM